MNETEQEQYAELVRDLNVLWWKYFGKISPHTHPSLGLAVALTGWLSILIDTGDTEAIEKMGVFALEQERLMT